MTILHTAHLRAHSEHVEQYKARLLRHARTSLEREPGLCLRFDVHQDVDDPTLFLLIEQYADQAALDAHRASAHFARYRADTDGWVAERTWWYWTSLPLPASTR